MIGLQRFVDIETYRILNDTTSGCTCHRQQSIHSPSSVSRSIDSSHNPLSSPSIGRTQVGEHMISVPTPELYLNHRLVHNFRWLALNLKVVIHPSDSFHLPRQVLRALSILCCLNDSV